MVILDECGIIGSGFSGSHHQQNADFGSVVFLESCTREPVRDLMYLYTAILSSSSRSVTPAEDRVWAVSAALLSSFLFLSLSSRKADE